MSLRGTVLGISHLGTVLEREPGSIVGILRVRLVQKNAVEYDGFYDCHWVG